MLLFARGSTVLKWGENASFDGDFVVFSSYFVGRDRTAIIGLVKSSMPERIRHGLAAKAHIRFPTVDGGYERGERHAVVIDADDGHARRPGIAFIAMLFTAKPKLGSASSQVLATRSMPHVLLSYGEGVLNVTLRHPASNCSIASCMHLFGSSHNHQFMTEYMQAYRNTGVDCFTLHDSGDGFGQAFDRSALRRSLLSSSSVDSRVDVVPMIANYRAWLGNQKLGIYDCVHRYSEAEWTLMPDLDEVIAVLHGRLVDMLRSLPASTFSLIFLRLNVLTEVCDADQSKPLLERAIYANQYPTKGKSIGRWAARPAAQVGMAVRIHSPRNRAVDRMACKVVPPSVARFNHYRQHVSSTKTFSSPTAGWLTASFCGVNFTHGKQGSSYSLAGEKEPYVQLPSAAIPNPRLTFANGRQPTNQTAVEGMARAEWDINTSVWDRMGRC